MKKIAIFIDAANAWNIFKKRGKMLDYSAFKSFFEKEFKGEMFNIYYYVSYPKDGTRPKENLDKIHKFFTYLKKGLKFKMIKKSLKTIYLRDKKGKFIFDQNTGKVQSIEKGNLDVEITIDAIRYSSFYDIAIFLTGDSDFLPLVNYLREMEKPKKVYVFSTEGSISHELKTKTDGYFDICKYPEITLNNSI